MGHPQSDEPLFAERVIRIRERYRQSIGEGRRCFGEFDAVLGRVRRALSGSHSNVSGIA
jgi:hypothetical protein